MRGGIRKGAGAPKKPTLLKKNPVNIKIQQWLIDWTGKQYKSRAVLIEEALIKTYRLECPVKDRRE